MDTISNSSTIKSYKKLDSEIMIMTVMLMIMIMFWGVRVCHIQKSSDSGVPRLAENHHRAECAQILLVESLNRYILSHQRHE